MDKGREPESHEMGMQVPHVVFIPKGRREKGNSLDGAGEAVRILVNEASRIERAQHLQATPYERSAQRVDYANGYKNKTVLTRMGEVTFEVLAKCALAAFIPAPWSAAAAPSTP